MIHKGIYRVIQKQYYWKQWIPSLWTVISMNNHLFSLSVFFQTNLDFRGHLLNYLVTLQNLKTKIIVIILNKSKLESMYTLSTCNVKLLSFTIPNFSHSRNIPWELIYLLESKKQRRSSYSDLNRWNAMSQHYASVETNWIKWNSSFLWKNRIDVFFIVIIWNPTKTGCLPSKMSLYLCHRTLRDQKILP